MNTVTSNTLLRKLWRTVRRILFLIAAILVVVVVAFIIDAERNHDARLAAGLDAPVARVAVESRSDNITVLQLSNRDDLGVRIRVIRPEGADQPLRTLLVIGGHRTGSRAVELAGTPECCAVVAIDYPLETQVNLDTLASISRSVTAVRRAALDTVPSVSLIVTWLEQQEWVNNERIELVGVSLGVPFATTAAALDERIDKLWAIHGADDNFVWIKHNVALRGNGPVTQFVFSRLIYWLLYAPSFDTGARIATVSPRQVVVIGARADERTPPGQTEALFAAAGEPKQLLWTDGNHIEPDRGEIVRRLLEMLEVR